MATVTIAPVTAGTTTASDVNDALYSSETNSMQVINGHLESANLTGSLTSDHIREQALANGKMVAATGNLDCFAEVYPKELGAAGASKPISGASIEFYLPYDPSLVIITWNIGAGNNIRNTSSKDKEVRLFVDGTRQVGCGREMAAQRNGSDARDGDLLLNVDFRYSGHKTLTGMTKGFHSASLRLFVGAQMVRVRVRDIKVIWFR